MVRAVVFDCFGVVISDALSLVVAEREATDPEGAAEVRRLVVLAGRGLMEPVQANRRIARILDLDYDDYRRAVADGETRNWPLLDYIVELKRRYKTGLLSNVSKGGLTRRFSADELDRYFDATVASAEVGYAKPEARAYEVMADRLGVRCDECVFIDDREDYCEGARAVGMRAVLYEDFPQFERELQALLADA